MAAGEGRQRGRKLQVTHPVCPLHMEARDCCELLLTQPPPTQHPFGHDYSPASMAGACLPRFPSSRTAWSSSTGEGVVVERRERGRMG